MTPWYFYVIIFSTIFVLTCELLNPILNGKHKTAEYNQDWHHSKCKCGYCEDVHLPAKILMK